MFLLIFPFFGGTLNFLLAVGLCFITDTSNEERNRKMKKTTYFILAVLWILCCTLQVAGAAELKYEYHLLATNKTSTMEKELGESASHGYRFKAVMGGETSFGGSEVVVIMERDSNNLEPGRYQYRLLATNKTSTMQKELQAEADEGYHYCGQTVFNTTFGGQEVVIILERDRNDKDQLSWDYKLLGTNKTSTMQKELMEAAEEGFEVTGLTVGSTTFGGNELVTILQRRRANQ